MFLTNFNKSKRWNAWKRVRGDLTNNVNGALQSLLTIIVFIIGDSELIENAIKE